MKQENASLQKKNSGLITKVENLEKKNDECKELINLHRSTRKCIENSKHTNDVTANTEILGKLEKTEEELNEYKQLLRNNAAISQKLHDRVKDLNTENIKLRGDTDAMALRQQVKGATKNLEEKTKLCKELQTALKKTNDSLFESDKKVNQLTLENNENKAITLELRNEVQRLSKQVQELTATMKLNTLILAMDCMLNKLVMVMKYITKLYW